MNDHRRVALRRDHEHRYINPDAGDGTPTFNDPVCMTCGLHPEADSLRDAIARWIGQSGYVRPFASDASPRARAEAHDRAWARMQAEAAGLIDDLMRQGIPPFPPGDGTPDSLRGAS